MADKFAFRPGVALKREDSFSLAPGFDIHIHGIHKDNKRVGHVRVMTDTRHPDEAYISDVRVEGGPNTLGPSGVRHIAKQIKKEYPNAKSVSGDRISGARGKAIEAKGGDAELDAPRVVQKLK